MLYLIGGPARCGKSTLAKRMHRVVDGQIISGDAFIASLRNTLNENVIPDIFVHSIDPIRPLDEPTVKINRLRRRDDAAWSFYREYILAAQQHSKDDILLEGNIWPHYISSVPGEKRVVFLVDTSLNQAERLIALRDARGDNDWMLDNHYTDNDIRNWATFNKLRSDLVVALCQQHSQVFFDIREYGMQGAENRAFDYLCK